VGRGDALGAGTSVRPVTPRLSRRNVRAATGFELSSERLEFIEDVYPACPLDLLPCLHIVLRSQL